MQQTQSVDDEAIWLDWLIGSIILPPFALIEAAKFIKREQIGRITLPKVDSGTITMPFAP